MALTGYLFYLDILNAVTQTILWCIVFFFASAAASAGYLTVSEVFPMEIRAMAIALFYAIATALGGISGPIIFGQLIGTGNATNLFIGYLIGAGLMIFAAVIELVLGVRAEGQSLENVATPLLYQGVGRGERQRRAREALEKLASRGDLMPAAARLQGR